MVVVTETPVHAAGCEWDTGNVYSHDYRWVSLHGCRYGQVRHHYDPPWSGNVYWTPWERGKRYAETQHSAELFEGSTRIAR
jgi:hypothetical protein